MKQAKRTYYSSIISENACSQKVLFNTIDRLLHRKTERQYPSCDSTQELGNNVSEFFVNKITAIRSELPSFQADDNTLSSIEHTDSPRFNCVLDHLAPATDSEVFGLIAFKSCCLGPIPASLLGLCLETNYQSSRELIFISIKHNAIITKTGSVVSIVEEA